MVKKHPGIKDARLNFAASKIIVVGNISVKEIEKIGAFEGIKVAREGQENQIETRLWVKYRQALLPAISLILIIVAFVIRWVGGALEIPTILFIIAAIFGGWGNFKKGIPSLLRLNFNMNTLMTVAVAGALAIGYWEEAAVVAFLFGVSEFLEGYTMEKARQSIRGLMDIAPKTAVVVRNGEEINLPVEEIQVGDIMIVKPGEKIAMDGLVVKGSTSVNQAAITGESIPADKVEGDEVYAGSLNQSGSIEVKVTKLVQDTTIAKIIAMVEEAQEQRAPSQAFVDRFAKYYTPTVLLLAIGIALVPPLLWGASWTIYIYKALALLIVACPCALVVSTPVAIVSAIGNAARNGVLIKGGLHLENAGSLKAIAFDKTGTLTQGEPVVTDIIAFGEISEEDVLSLAAGVEKLSEHPLAVAIVKHAVDKGIPLADAHGFRAITGKGAQAVVDGKTYLIGNPRLLDETGIDLSSIMEKIAQVQSEGKTCMLLGTNRQVLGVIAVADQIREKSISAVLSLKKSGVAKVIMLTGDNEATAKAIAGKLDIDYQAELLPEDKVSAVKKLRETYKYIGMVGDGINDAPALATATVGIAMGGAGTDTAMETADIVLMADDLSKLPFTVKLSRDALKVIKQNIAFSILIKVIATFLVFPGWLTLWLAIFADMGASILVTLNGIRLLRIKS